MRRCSLRRPTLLGLAVMALAGCGDDTGPTGRVTRVVVLPEHPSVAVGQTVQMTATPYDSEGSPVTNAVLRWQVGDASRATVSTSGLVTGVSVGSTSILATSEGVTGSTDLQVTAPTPPVASVTVEPGTLKVAPGRLGRLVAILRDESGEPFTGPTVTWSSAEPAVAAVDARGVVSANAQGTTTVTATAEGLSATATVSVDPVFEIVSLDITPTSASVPILDTVHFRVTAKDALGETLDGRLVEWSSEPVGFVTVSEEGVVTGFSTGETTVRAVADGLAAEATVTVLPPLIGSIEVLPGNMTFGHGAKVTLMAVLRNRAGVEMTDRTVTWHSADPAAVEVVQSFAYSSNLGGYAVEVIGHQDGTTELVAESESVSGSTPLHVTTVRFRSFERGLCGLTLDGRAYCVGNNDFGRLGQGGIVGGVRQLAPVLVAPGLTFTDLAVGPEHTCGVSEVGAAYCWGFNSVGQLGVASAVPGCRHEGAHLSCSADPLPVSGGLSFSELDAGPNNTCGLTTAAAVYCWGLNTANQNGAPSTADCDGSPCNRTPVPVAGNRQYVTVKVGTGHACAITTDASTFCWGDNGQRQLGSPAATTGSMTLVSGGHRFISLAPGVGHTCALDDAHIPWCWGENDYGQLGQGVISDIPTVTPTALLGSPVFEQLATRDHTTCGLRPDGGAVCWGLDLLGSGIPGKTGTPRPVLGGLSFEQGEPSCGLASDGLVYCWEDGQPTLLAGQ
jgi:uncharacterized protein YjdB